MMRKYWYVYKSWVNNFEELTTFFDYPPEIRKIIYTVNTIENLNRSIRVFRFFKNSVFFLLFLDLNHCLMNNTSKEEQFFKKDKIIFINNLISNVE